MKSFIRIIDRTTTFRSIFNDVFVGTRTSRYGASCLRRISETNTRRETYCEARKKTKDNAICRQAIQPVDRHGYPWITQEPCAAVMNPLLSGHIFQL